MKLFFTQGSQKKAAWFSTRINFDSRKCDVARIMMPIDFVILVESNTIHIQPLLVFLFSHDSLAGNLDRSKMSVFVVGVDVSGAAGQDGRIQVADEILEVWFSLCLSVFLSVCPSVHPSVCLVCLSIGLFLWMCVGEGVCDMCIFVVGVDAIELLDKTEAYK